MGQRFSTGTFFVCFFMAFSFVFAGCGGDDDSSDEAGKCFQIYLASESVNESELADLDIGKVRLAAEPIISHEDIETYLREAHVIHLTPEGTQKLKDSPRIQTGEAFFACVGNQPVYAGVFWSNIMSRPYGGPVILADSFDEDMIRIERAYPSSSWADSESDVRSDPKIMAALRECGKLAEDSVDVNDSDPILANFSVFEKDGIEYLLNTDKAVYQVGEKVGILYRITNKSGTAFEAGSVPDCESCQYESHIVWNGEEIWRNCRVIPPCGFTSFVLNPNDFRDYEYEWEMTNDNGTFEEEDDLSVTSPGTYQLTAELRIDGHRVPVSLSFEVEEPASAAEEAEIVRSERSRELSPDVPESDLRELSAGNPAFAFDLYRKLRESEGNLFYSPYSISLALAMAYAGAREETEREMSETCHFTLPQESLHPAFNALDLDLAARGKDGQGQDGQGFRLNIANSAWGQKGHDFLPDFLDLLAENYDAGMRLLDFVNAPEPSRTIINDWISEKTEKKIKDLIPPGGISDITRLVLVNAIYFNAAWEEPFEEELTREDVFRLPNGEEITVPMMSMKHWFRYGEGEDFQAAELPYEGGEISMLILLPREGRFEAFEESLDSERLAEITENLLSRNLALMFPRFEYESESIRLGKILSDLGMPTAFSWPGADFSGMDGTLDFYISDVLHKGFVSVDEAGTEAAAATAVIMDAGAIPSEPVAFTANRPFVFLIRDMKTGTILFVGRILNPLG